MESAARQQPQQQTGIHHADYHYAGTSGTSGSFADHHPIAADHRSTSAAAATAGSTAAAAYQPPQPTPEQVAAQDATIDFDSYYDAHPFQNYEGEDASMGQHLEARYGHHTERVKGLLREHHGHHAFRHRSVGLTVIGSRGNDGCMSV